MEEKDNLELYEEIEHNIQERFNRMTPEDPNRKTLREDLVAISEIRNQYAQTEQNRLNNNAQNDINEERLKVDQRKVEVEREKNLMMAGLSLLNTGFGAYLHGKSYHMDEHGWSYKPLKEYALRLVGRGGSGK